MKNTIVTKKDYLGRPTYSVEEKKEFLELWRESKLTKKEFCKEFGLNYKSFNNWPYQIASKKPKPITCQEVQMPKAKEPETPILIEVLFPSGFQLKVPNETSAEWLSKLIRSC